MLKLGLDYFDTLSVIANLTYVRLFMSLDASQCRSLHQLDIKNIFPYGVLQEALCT